MTNILLTRDSNADGHFAVEQKTISICLIGGIYGYNRKYRSRVTMTPETILESGFRERGHRVVTRGHNDRIDLRDVDVVHVHHCGVGGIRVASSNSRAALVFTSHDGPAMAGLPVPVAFRAAARFIMSRADAVVALSQAEAKFQADTLPLAGAIHRVIPNGIDAENYQYSRHESVGKGRAWRLLFVGQLIELKGVDQLLQALALLPQNVALQLVFHVDMLRDRFEQLSRQLGLQNRVRFLGSKSPAELRILYQQSDVLVLPSFAEALPSVVTEAMLCGTPVVATDVGGIRDQLGGYGIVVPPRQPEELAAAIGHVLEHYDEFAEEGESMSQYARRRFSVDTMVENHLELYRSLLDGKGTRRRQSFLARPVNVAAQLAVRLLCKTL